MKVARFCLFVLITLLAQGVLIAEAGSKNTSPKISEPVEVVFETTLGSFTLELNPERAPATVENFLRYVDEGFYDNTLFHRVIPGFVAQGGGFEKGMKRKATHSPVRSESDNGLKNVRGTVSMARTRDPHSATSQFFINLAQNPGLNTRAYRPGYTVFGKVTDGMEVIDEIARVPTGTSGRHKDAPKEDIVILSGKRKTPTGAHSSSSNADASEQGQEAFTAGQHYVVLDEPVPTRDQGKVEVVEIFSYGCPHCYEFEPVIGEWGRQQSSDVDFWHFPAVWNDSMKLYAHAFYAAKELKVLERTHHPLFTAIVIEQRRLSSQDELADFFVNHGVDREDFMRAFDSTEVENQVREAEARVRSYKPAGVPEIIVNGKYRVDRMRAGGQKEMLAVVDYLVDKERALSEE